MKAGIADDGDGNGHAWIILEMKFAVLAETVLTLKPACSFRPADLGAFYCTEGVCGTAGGEGKGAAARVPEQRRQFGDSGPNQYMLETTPATDRTFEEMEGSLGNLHARKERSVGLPASGAPVFQGFEPWRLAVTA
jgi:hypothetical protein